MAHGEDGVEDIPDSSDACELTFKAGFQTSIG